MDDTFSKLFGDRLHELGWSTRMAGERLHVSHVFVFGLINNKEKPPLERLPGWFDILELEPAERERWQVAAELEHVPPAMRARWHQQQATISDLTKRVAELESHYKAQ